MSAWTPGDPLHSRGDFGNYLYNFRDDRDGERCTCSDAASWPEPSYGHRLSDVDELTAFIAECRTGDAA